MQVIIMSNGKGSRWGNYCDITKQEIVINNERLLDRTVRMLKEKGLDNIYILSDNPKHNNIEAKRIHSNYNDYYHQKYAYDFLNMETLYLYGDTFYLDIAINEILSCYVNDIMFFGNNKAICALKVNDFLLMKEIIDNINTDMNLYHNFDKIGNNDKRFKNLEDTFFNINTPEDYKKLKKRYEVKCLKKTL